MEQSGAIEAKPIREYTVMDITEMDQFQLSALRLRAVAVAQLPDLNAVRDRMLDYIHLQSCMNAPAKLSTLNRRFGRACKAHGATASVLVEALAMLKAVQTFEHRGSTIVISQRVLAEREAMLDPAEYAGMLDLIISKAE